MKIDANKLYRLRGAVQHYAWGGHEFIPGLLSLSNDQRQPFAEYWLGAHRSAPSIVINDQHEWKLNELLSDHPQLLGDAVQENFGELPYLLKILDVKEMLSIQVHPTKEEAQIGFAAEEERGLPMDAANRNYKDRNHKPEVMVALSEFWLLHGFKTDELLRKTLNEVPELRSLSTIYEAAGLKELFSHVMELPQRQVDSMLVPLVQKEVRRRSFHESEPDEPGYWVGEYYRNREMKLIDRGVFSIYFFNLLGLQPGESIFQAAGVPHAYLRGQNVELMANSDNVLRGGLTNKHIDVDELMKHTRFEGITPAIISPAANGAVTTFPVPVEDFLVSKMELEADVVCRNKARSVEICICTEGSATATAANELLVNKGDAFIVFAGAEYSLRGNENAVLYRASVP